MLGALLFIVGIAQGGIAQGGGAAPQPPARGAAGGPMTGAPTTAPIPSIAVPPNAPAPRRAVPAGAPATPAPRPPAPASATPPPQPAAPAPQKPAPADKVLRPTLDRTKGTVGDVFDYTLQIVHDPAERYLVPPEPTFKPFELRGRDFYKRTRDDGLVEETFVFRITLYQVGSHRIPAIDIPFVTKEGRTKRAVAQDIDVTIESVLPAAQAGAAPPALKDIKPPLHLVVRDFRLLWLAGILAGAALLGLLGYIGYRYGKRIAARERPAPPPPPPRPAHLIAYEKFGHARLPTTDAELRHFYELVSNITREYYGNRYGFLALDMTTTEILRVLRPIAAAGAAPGLQIADAQRFLSDADLVKFAKFVPGSDEPSRYLLEARRLVDVTRAPDEVPSAPEGPAAHASAAKKAA